MPQTLVQLLHESAGRFGTRTALLFEPGFRYQRWSHAELWKAGGTGASRHDNGASSLPALNHTGGIRTALGMARA